MDEVEVTLTDFIGELMALDVDPYTTVRVSGYLGSDEFYSPMVTVIDGKVVIG